MSEPFSTRKLEFVDAGPSFPYVDHQYWAVLIGISEYQYSDWKLNYAHRDAEELYKQLLKLKGARFQAKQIVNLFEERRIRKLVNQEATTANITDALRDFLQRPGENDIVFLFFACHGAPDPNRTENLYLLTHDTDPNRIAGTALPMREIRDAVKENLRANKAIILADTCHSGGISFPGLRSGDSPTTNRINNYLQDLQQASKGNVIFTSAEKNQLSREGEQWGGGHGIFTHYLLEGLRGEADRDQNGIVTLGELLEYVRDQVKADTKDKQHPSISTDFDRRLPIAIVDQTKAIAAIEAEVNRTGEREQSRQRASESQILLKSFEFKFAKINVVVKPVRKPVEKQGLFGKKIEYVETTETSCNIGYQDGKAEYFEERLDAHTVLEMVKIKGGNFTMGSPSSEKGRSDDEGPQHLVRIQPFFMGRYAVTQEQWFTVAQDFPKVKIDLNPDPSYFKGARRPVEQVNWWEAVEFCDRLSQKTGKTYCLPSEAEWEYACRAGTTTPFYCGETITTDLANYDGNYTYGSGTNGVYRAQTIDVGSFPPNGFGLYDMHGNVCEWCADHGHENYQGAPIDGSTWIKGGDSDRLLLRGGSWNYDPWYCRSAYRNRYDPDYRSGHLGFRVVYSAAGTPS